MSTYDNTLRLEEIGTGERSGTWGTATNLNLSLIGRALGRSVKSIPNQPATTLTIPDGTNTNAEARSMYLELTGGGQNCIVTLAPNTISKLWIIKNSTNFPVEIAQGSGSVKVTIPKTSTKLVVTDGAGNSAAVYDALSALSLTGEIITAEKFVPTADTTAGNAAAIGYTAADGIIITGQGSNNDVTIKNDADADVLKILTGTEDVTVKNDLITTSGTLNPGGDTAASDTAAVGYTAVEGIIVTGQGSTNDVTIKNNLDASVIAIPTGGTATTFAGSVKPLTYQETRPTPDTAVTGTKSIDLSTGNVFEHTLTGNVTYTLTNPPASGTAYGFTLKITQGSGGNKIVTWPASIKWTLGVPAVLSTGAGDVDVFTFFTTDGGTTYYGFTVGKRVS